MECVVHRVPMRHPGDASAIIRLIDQGVLSADTPALWSAASSAR